MGIGGEARTILLATGVMNRRPPMDESLHDELARGLIRYADLRALRSDRLQGGGDGSGAHGVAEAVFLRGLPKTSPDRARRAHDLRAEDQAQLRALGIHLVDGPCHAVAALDEAIVVETPHGHHTFDSVYPALGSDVHNEHRMLSRVGWDPPICRLCIGAPGAGRKPRCAGSERLRAGASVRGGDASRRRRSGTIGEGGRSSADS
jgi:thioredoxin reductase (NADPH)